MATEASAPPASTSIADGAASPGQIERDIESLRSELGELMEELDRRRHEVLDLRLQIRRHGALIALGVTAAIAVGGGAVLWRSYAERRRERVASRMARSKFVGLSIGYEPLDYEFREADAGEKLPPYADCKGCTVGKSGDSVSPVT